MENLGVASADFLLHGESKVVIEQRILLSRRWEQLGRVMVHTGDSSPAWVAEA